MVNTPRRGSQGILLLSEAEIQIMLVTTSDVDISILVSAHELGDALSVMRDAFGVTPREVSF